MDKIALKFLIALFILGLPGAVQATTEAPLPEHAEQVMYRALIQEAAVNAGVTLSDPEISSLLWLFRSPEKGTDGYFQALRTRATTEQLLEEIRNSTFNATNVTKAEEQQNQQRILSVLIEEGERGQATSTYVNWWPLVFLSYTLPMKVGEETQLVRQNSELLADADAFSEDDTTKLERLISYHEQEKTPTYGWALVARAIGNMTLMSQSQFDKVMATLDRNSAGLASKALNKLGLSRESFAGMNMSERALFVVDIISFIPVINMKAQVLIFIGSFTYKHINKVLKATGADQLLEGLVKDYGLDRFEDNYPTLHGLSRSAKAALTTAGDLGKTAVKGAQGLAVGAMDSKLAANLSGGISRFGSRCRALLQPKDKALENDPRKSESGE